MTDEKNYRGVRILSIPIGSSTATAATITSTFGDGAWKLATFPERPPADHPVYALVGRLANDWAHVDHTLDILICELADVDGQAGACITAQIPGTFGRFNAIIQLLHFHQQKTNRNLKPLIDKATELAQKSNMPGNKRHRGVHDPWYVYPPSEDKTGQFKAMPRQDPRYGIYQVDMKDLDEDLRAVKKFADRVTEFRKAVLGALVTSPDRPQTSSAG
jgi:hypothetical protein